MRWGWLLCLFLPALLLLPAIALHAQADAGEPLDCFPWWVWAMLLFVFAFGLGIVAVITGVGGGVLFVPVVSALFPFHLDFVRGAGLMVALSGALSAAPTLLRQRLASVRLALPLALFGSMGSIAGALVGLALSQETVYVLMGSLIIAIVIIMIISHAQEYPLMPTKHDLAERLGLSGSYTERTTGREVQWRVHRLVLAMALFLGIGFLGGMFGIGAGWANVPAINLILGAPLKVAVATSGMVIAINGTSAAWIYLHNGAVLPAIAVPSVAGMMLGTRLGARLLGATKPRSIKIIVILMLLLAGLRSLLAGLGVL